MNRHEILTPPLFALLIVAAAAGCTAAGPGGDATPAGSPTAETPPGTVVVEATVVRVVDGDTLKVRYSGGVPDTVRLLGVDAPELSGPTDPAEFEGVPDTAAASACLRAAGSTASEYLTDRLSGARVRIVLDPAADERDRYGRLLGYVFHGGRNVNYRLIEAGHARVFDAAFSKSEAFYAAESRAQAAGRGVWACRTPGTTTPGGHSLVVAEVHADAAGRDGENLNDEYVVFRNAGEAAIDLSGWTVADAAGHAYAVPDGVTLSPNATLILHTGWGRDDATDRYWGASTPVWNNDGDVIVVTNASGAVVLRHAYGREATRRSRAGAPDRARGGSRGLISSPGASGNPWTRATGLPFASGSRPPRG